MNGPEDEPQTAPGDEATKYDDPRFNEGVQHVVDLLAKTIGSTDWVAGDGSEDYDEDLATTLLNILAAKGLYDRDEGTFATLPAANAETQTALERCSDCPPVDYPTDATRCAPCDQSAPAPANAERLALAAKLRVAAKIAGNPVHDDIMRAAEYLEKLRAGGLREDMQS